MAKTAWISLLVTAFLAAGCYYYWFVNRKRRTDIPVQWKQVGKVENIIMYPLKSGALRQLKEARCAETGLVELDNAEKLAFHDRCFVLYDQRLVPLKLVAYKPAVRISVESVDHDTVVFSAPNINKIQLKLSTFLASPRKVQLSAYGSTMEAIDCGEEISEWMSRCILGTGKGFRLGFYLENVCHRRGAVEILRNDSPKLLSVYNARDNDSGTFADLASYMIVSVESVNNVNAKLPVEDRFHAGNLRPNIVVSGCDKYAEDDWNWIKIGDEVIMKQFKPCTRCLMVTINPNTGEANKNLQPFKLLKTYRTIKQLKGYDVEGNSPVLGAYLGLYKTGFIQLGDPVYTDL